jgi:hypothetical protein
MVTIISSNFQHYRRPKPRHPEEVNKMEEIDKTFDNILKTKEKGKEEAVLDKKWEERLRQLRERRGDTLAWSYQYKECIS